MTNTYISYITKNEVFVIEHENIKIHINDKYYYNNEHIMSIFNNFNKLISFIKSIKKSNYSLLSDDNVIYLHSCNTRIAIIQFMNTYCIIPVFNLNSTKYIKIDYDDEKILEKMYNQLKINYPTIIT